MKFNKKILLPVLLISPFAFSSMTFASENSSSNSNTINITFELTNDAVFTETGLNTKTINIKKSLKWKYVKAKAPTGSDISVSSGYTFKTWQYLDESSAKVDITDDYQFNSDVTLYSRFIDSSVTLTFALPEDETVKTEFDLPAESAKVANETIWDDSLKSTYNPKVKSTVETPTMYFVNYKNEYNEILGTDIGSEGVPLTPELITAEKPNRFVFTATFNKFISDSFVDDSWDIVIAAADKGFSNMSTASHGEDLGYVDEYKATSFDYNGTTYTKEANTFVGLRKAVNIGGADYTVRVIGEKADELYGEKNVTTLTFEFVDTISDARSYASSFNVTNEWETSALRQSLYKGGDLFSILPSSLQKGIKQVSKTTYKGISEPSSSFVTTDEYLFPLSLSEIGFRRNEESTIGDKQQPVLDEGSSYKYYNYDDASKEPAGLRNKNILGGSNISYYLRSPELNISVCSWYIDSSTTYGEPNKAMDVTYGLGVAPAFGIGETIVEV